MGGQFTTDAGRNRYWRPEGKPPTPLAAGCYLARWQFHNTLIRPRIYLGQRSLTGVIARPTPTGLPVIDGMNPRLFSNNLLLPYLVAIWEEFHKCIFTALLRYSPRRPAVLKAARLPQDQLESVAAGSTTIEDVLAESLSFQRPTNIAAHFRLLDQSLDLGATLRKPYRRRKVTLFDSIEALVEQRHSFVHSGAMDTNFSDKKLTAALGDFEVAGDRVYQRCADHYGWTAVRDF